MAIKFEVDPEDTIDINVISHNEPIVKFRMKKRTPLRKLMQLYSERIGFTVAQLRFYFDTRCFYENDTPFSLKMKDGDFIEVHKQQRGGTDLS